MPSLLQRLGPDRVRQWLPLATLVLLVAVVGLLEPVFLQPATLLELAGDTAVLFILATGVTFVIMLGGIDLSLQSMASLSSVIVALALPRLGYGAFAAALAAGALAGFLSGLAHTRLRIPSFIATLAMGACSSRRPSSARASARSPSAPGIAPISAGSPAASPASRMSC